MLHLASQSPRRRELLGRLGVPFGVLDLEIPEQRAPGEPAEDYVRRVAREKAGAGLLEVMTVPGAVVLGGDTEVVLDDEVFGKPRDEADAAAMLRRLSGRTHRVISAVSLVSADREAQAVSTSEVTFAELDEEAIARYVTSGEAMGRAGAYAIQGIAQTFISHLSGSYSGVMGLPLYETACLLQEFGLRTGGEKSGVPRPAEQHA
jgi:septum formation protein